MRSLWIAAVLWVTPISVYAQSDLLEQARDFLKQVPSSTADKSQLSAGQADSGVREALRVAAQRSVSRVGAADGFLQDPAIHIPLPGYLENAKSALGTVGTSGMLDDLELRMNRAAEQAAGKAFKVFADAISKMSIADAKNIVTGPKDAATQYLRRTTSGELTREFRPIVDRSLSDAGAIRAYNAVSQRASSSAGGLGALGGMLGGGASGEGGGGFDFTGYVVDKGLDGIFHYVAQEEAAIRTNPASRPTELLQRVFGGS